MREIPEENGDGEAGKRIARKRRDTKSEDTKRRDTKNRTGIQRLADEQKLFGIDQGP